jgi:hypothetical protein
MASKKAPLTRCNGTMTESQYLSWIRSALRSKSLRWPPRAECLKLARRAYKGTNKAQKWEYLCSLCQQWQLGKNCQVDHFPIDAGSILSVDDIGEFCNNLYCEVSNLRCLCKSCHATYTLSCRAGVSMEDAAVMKQVNELMKQPTDKVLAFLSTHGYNGASVSNAAKRKALVEQILKETT